MIDLYDWLRNYFSYQENFHPTFDQYKAKQKENLPWSKEFKLEELQLTCKADHFITEKNLTHISITVWEKILIMGSDKKAKDPFKIPDCNYSLYGIYLNILAYISGQNYYRLTIVHNPSERKIHEVKYRPDIAAFALNCRRIQINDLQKEINKEESTGTANQKTNNSYSLFG